MTTLTNEYNDLLSFLEQHNQQTDVDPTSIKKNNAKKNQVTLDTKHILEECQTSIHSDIPQMSNKTNFKSKGFDVSRFEQQMRSKLIDNYKKLQSYERPYISVGELFTCLRKNYYNRQRYPIDVKKEFQFAYLYLFQRVGDTIHDILQTVYDFTEIEKTIVSEKFKVKGRLDALKNEFIFEIKSIDQKKFNGTYHELHFLQANIYAFILNTEYNFNIEYVTIVYVSRNLVNIYPFDIPVNPASANSFLKRAFVLRNALNKNQVPEPIGSDIDQCKFCSFQTFCENDKCEMDIPFLQKQKEEKTNNKSVFLL